MAISAAYFSQCSSSFSQKHEMSEAPINSPINTAVPYSLSLSTVMTAYEQNRHKIYYNENLCLQKEPLAIWCQNALCLH